MDGRALEPALGTPPGSPGPRHDEGDRALASSKAEKYALDDAPVASPHDSLGASTDTIDSGRAEEERQKKAALGEDNDEDEFHDIALNGVGVVTKSIYKEKRGFLSRLRDTSSSVRSKYAPSDTVNHAVIPADGQHKAELTIDDPKLILRKVEDASANVEVVLEDEEPIHVAIDQIPLPPQSRLQDVERRTVHEQGFPNDEVSEDRDTAPQVVIHSAESDSDSGFATLNPVINRTGRGKRGSTSAIASNPSGGCNLPVLLSLPVAEESAEPNERLLLVIHALGATGLAKVERFGTQSTLLEMRLCESAEQLSSGAAHLPYLRTAVHRKGGSEAQWNQQFTTGLQSKSRQQLHIAVRTHSKLLVGESMVPLIAVTDELYDQHFSIYRTAADGSRENAGQVHLQLRIKESHTVSINPPLVVANPTLLSRRIEIPPVLRNGALMFKIPYHTHGLLGSVSSKRQWISVSGGGQTDDVYVTWCDPIDTSEKSRRLDVNLITEIREGAQTKAFERFLQSEPSTVARESGRCFSIVSKTRTLDLVAASKEDAAVWIYCLRQVVFGVHDPSVTASAQAINDHRQSARISRDPQPQSSSTSKKEHLQQWRSYVFDFARHDEIDSISKYLHEGCPVDLLETGTGDTLLMLACRLGNTKLVELCLQWRAKNDPHPEFGETALQVAVNAGHSECLRLILSTAANSDMDSEIVNHIDSSNNAPLHVAARKGDLACLQLLLHHGADICVVEEFGRTPLHCAALSGSLDCVAYLLDVGGDSVLNAGDHDGDTVLHYAALAGEENIVKLLLESAADIQSANTHGETALDLARRENHSACEQLIAKYLHADSVEKPSAEHDGASSLLPSRQKYEYVDCDDETDGMDEGEERELDDLEAYMEPSYSPVRRGPIESVQREELVLAHIGDFRIPHSSCSPPPITRSQTISPSARVREVLASHRERMSMYRPPPVPPFRSHSARDEFCGQYALDRTWIPPRQALTERFDREHRRDRGYSHPRYERYDIEGSNFPYDKYVAATTSFGDDRYLSAPPTRGRTMSAMSSYAYLSHEVQECGHLHSQQQYYHNHDWRQNRSYVANSHHYGAWEDAREERSGATSAQLEVTPDSCLWDTYYSDEGYPYYVNRRTGDSQWENPFEAVPQPQEPPPSPPVLAHIDSEVFSGYPAETVLAGNRMQNNLKVSTEETLLQDGRSTAVTPIHPSGRTSPSRNGDRSVELSACRSPSSKYEVRTGLTLTVDVASPQRQEDRPVYIASPRSHSPRKSANGREPEITNETFGKSPRASSPRGKSKNVQIIDLKRANNLAMALASFKINGRNEQVVQAIASLDDKVVNAELLLCLQRFFPTDEETAALKSFEGTLNSLGPAERFFFQLLRVPDVTQKMEYFLYKLQFGRSYRIVHSRIQVVKRACRDLVENYSFVQALTEFFKTKNTMSLQTIQANVSTFRLEYLPRVDDKLHSFHDDLQKASEIDLFDLQLHINRLLTGIRPLQAFVDRTSPPDDQDIAAHDVLQRFLRDTRGKLNDLESEYESLGQWENRVLGLFGESKATCQLTAILECVCSILENARC